MASIWRDARSGNFLIKFHFGGRRYTRSCWTSSQPEAKRLKARVEETIGLLNTGRLQVPESGTDPGVWIISGGRLDEKPRFNTPSLSRLGEICDAYYTSQLDKARTTLVGERVHIGHLKRHLGPRKQLDAVTLDELQEYVNTRTKESTRTGTTVSGKTIKKELTTFRQIWDWARRRGCVSRSCPFKEEGNRKWLISIPKPEKSENFMTWSEIERRLARSTPVAAQAKELWKFVYLDEQERDELLEHVEKTAKYPFIYPMFVLAAYSGARRSEICRSLIDDLRMEDNAVVIRERKRRKDQAGTTRQVPLHPKLKAVMEAWFKTHPGGPYTVAPPLHMPRRKKKEHFEELSREEAHHHFKAALTGSKWENVRGFHVLRHSFGAICTRKGVPMNMIAKWMGHTTQEMMDLYQHLHPQDQQDWMAKL